MGHRERETPQGKVAEAMVATLEPYLTMCPFSRAEIAEKLGVSPGAITQALTPARYDASLPMIARIADLLNVDLLWEVVVRAVPKR